MDEVVKVWILLALLAASLEPIVAKIGYRGSLDPWQLLFLKNVFAAALILPITRRWRWLGWSGVGRVASVSLLLLLTNAATLWALRWLPATTVITLITSTPAFVALTNQHYGREKLSTKFWLGFGACFAGIALSLNSWEFSAAPLGLLAVAVAIFSSTVYRTRMESVTQEIPPLLVSTYIFLINGAISVALIWPWLAPLQVTSLGIGLWVGGAAAVANVAFLFALHQVGSTNMSLFNLLQRPLVIVAAAFILHEPLSLRQVLGVALVLWGVNLAQVRRATAR